MLCAHRFLRADWQLGLWCDNNHYLGMETLTRQYRESILRLALKYDGKVSWQSSQHILDQLWDDTEENLTQKIYGCQTCGDILHPGFLGTTLRVCRGNKGKRVRTRSQRRREQRKIRKQAFDQQKEANDPNKRSSLPQADDNNHPKFSLLEDEQSLTLDRNHLSIRCGRCQSKFRVKGIKKISEPVPALAKANVQSRVQHKRDDASISNKDTIDYVQLPSLANIDKKKKKKKKPASNLLSFLSSLND